MQLFATTTHFYEMLSVPSLLDQILLNFSLVPKNDLSKFHLFLFEPIGPNIRWVLQIS